VSGSCALFLDRDRVINHDAGYTSSAENFRFIDGIFDLSRVAIQYTHKVIVVTKQAGIGRGCYSESDFLSLTDWMRDRFDAKGVWIAGIFYCSFHPEHGVGDYKKESFDRKPNPGVLLRAAEKHGRDLGRSIMIGEKDSDMQAATKAGVGVRCHYLAGADEDILSNVATHKIHLLREGVFVG
jgi:D-glycero-D-manno-heptose 1,7-bisphosphate phosphatase